MFFLPKHYMITIISLLYLSSFSIKCFLILPINTIYIKDKTINDTDYFTYLTQNELYVKFKIGSNQEEIKSVLKMDKYGFLIYENAYDYNKSGSYERYYPDFEENMKTSWVPQSIEYPSKDILYLPSYNFTKKECDIINTNKIIFLRIKPKDNSSEFFNDMFKEYGIIGLKLNTNTAFNAPEFIKSLKASKDINSYSFFLVFENNYKKGFATNNNKGYFYIWKEPTKENEEYKSILFKECPFFGGELVWGMKFNHLYIKNKDNIREIENDRHQAKIFGTFPFIKGSKQYYDYISNNFFNDLIEKNICHQIDFIRHDIPLHRKYYSYACDSKSQYFMDRLDNNFPDLIIEDNDYKDTFTLTKQDLFTFNDNNDMDNNLYFLIIYGDDFSDWTLGIPFLKKYVFIYDYDSKMVGYYKNFGKEKEEPEEDDYNFFKSVAFKIILGVILVIIIFLLGMLFQKYYKKTRKKKANELDEDYEYEPHIDKEERNKSDNKNETEGLGINE